MFHSRSLTKTIKRSIATPFNYNYRYHAPDYAVLIVIALLVVLGVIFLSSAGSAAAFNKFGDAYYFIKNQILKGILPGIIFFCLAASFDYKKLKKYAPWLLIFSVALLVAVFVPGLGAGWGKASSWLKIGPFNFQPAEFVKLFFLIYLAAWLENKKQSGDLKKIKTGLVPFVISLGILSALIMAQPDFGTLLVLVAIAMGVYFVAEAPYKHFASLIGLGVVLLLIAGIISPYRLARLTSFVNPNNDVQGSGFQINQAKIAIGSGGIMGLGIGRSQQKNQYLPEPYGDSIFAIIAEEIGFIIVSLLIGLYLLLGLKAFSISNRAPDGFGKLLAAGIAIWLSFQAIINIAAMIGLFPLTGIPLPFISYGGSAMAVSLLAVGLLFNISKQTKNV